MPASTTTSFQSYSKPFKWMLSVALSPFDAATWQISEAEGGAESRGSPTKTRFVARIASTGVTRSTLSVAPKRLQKAGVTPNTHILQSRRTHKSKKDSDAYSFWERYRKWLPSTLAYTLKVRDGSPLLRRALERSASNVSWASSRAKTASIVHKCVKAAIGGIHAHRFAGFAHGTFGAHCQFSIRQLHDPLKRYFVAF